MACTKFLLLAVIALAVCIVYGQPFAQQDNFEELAKKFQEEAQRNFEEFKKQSQLGFPPAPLFDVKQFPQDGKVHTYGQSESKYHVESNINGKKTEQSGGKRVINDDGKITEYDLAG